MKLKQYVDLDVIRNNVIAAKRRAGADVMLMLKADAYGHGLLQVARACSDVADMFGVATVEEGEALRAAGIEKDILVLACAEDEVERAVQSGLIFGLWSLKQLGRAAKLAAKYGAEKVRFHLKLDSGMHRLGFCERQLGGVLEAISNCSLAPEGVYSHLRSKSFAQLKTFERMAAAVKAKFPDVKAHIAASKMIGVKRARFDLVRLGIGAYRGAMRVTSVVLQSRRLEAGEYIGYGTCRLGRTHNTAVVFGGYADGIDRERPTSVYIRGRRCKPLGTVCMDMFAVDTDDFLPQEGEEVTLLAPEFIDEAARERGTIDYTLLTSFCGRVERIFVNDKGAGEGDSPQEN